MKNVLEVYLFIYSFYFVTVYHIVDHPEVIQPSSTEVVMWRKIGY